MWGFLRNAPSAYCSRLFNLNVSRIATLSEETIVATDGGRYDVNIVKREKVAVYWEERKSVVRRCSWLSKGYNDNYFVPYEEHIAAKLEVGITWSIRLFRSTSKHNQAIQYVRVADARTMYTYSCVHALNPYWLPRLLPIIKLARHKLYHTSNWVRGCVVGMRVPTLLEQYDGIFYKYLLFTYVTIYHTLRYTTFLNFRKSINLEWLPAYGTVKLILVTKKWLCIIWLWSLSRSNVLTYQSK